ncbi:MAG UNVERIFIED_CONTAM: Rpn family recombination-promoting nuclease/putative transposase [Planctomycetaceae bacterium]|jgi:predicted transposase YdaD
MSNAHHARRFLQCILPLELLQELDLSTLRILPNNDTDDQLHEHFSDLIVEVRRNDSQQLVLYLVLEHKSYRDDMSSWQVLKYLVHRADRFLREGVHSPVSFLWSSTTDDCLGSGAGIA